MSNFRAICVCLIIFSAISGCASTPQNAAIPPHDTSKEWNLGNELQLAQTLATRGRATKSPMHMILAYDIMASINAQVETRLDSFSPARLLQDAQEFAGTDPTLTTLFTNRGTRSLERKEKLLYCGGLKKMPEPVKIVEVVLAPRGKVSIPLNFAASRNSWLELAGDSHDYGSLYCHLIGTLGKNWGKSIDASDNCSLAFQMDQSGFVELQLSSTSKQKMRLLIAGNWLGDWPK